MIRPREMSLQPDGMFFVSSVAGKRHDITTKASSRRCGVFGYGLQCQCGTHSQGFRSELLPARLFGTTALAFHRSPLSSHHHHHHHHQADAAEQDLMKKDRNIGPLVLRVHDQSPPFLHSAETGLIRFKTCLKPAWSRSSSSFF